MQRDGSGDRRENEEKPATPREDGKKEAGSDKDEEEETALLSKNKEPSGWKQENGR